MDNTPSSEDIKLERFPVLSRDNYREWIDLVEDVLTSKGLWTYASSSGSEYNTLEQTTNFEKNDAKASAFLKQAAGRENRVHLIGIRRSKEILAKLKTLNEGTVEERVQFLLSQFYGLKALASIDLTASRLTQLQTEIGGLTATEKPSDSSKKAVLINSLGEEFQSTVFALKAAGLSKLTFEDVTQRLKEVEASINRTSEETAYLTKEAKVNMGTGPKFTAKTVKPSLSCYYCGRIGHFQRDCWRRLKKEEEEREGEEEEEEERKGQAYETASIAVEAW